MKIVALLLIALTAASASWSQEWRDSLSYARSLYKKGEYDKALKYYKSAQKLAPEDVDLSEEEGQSAYRAGKYPEAEKAFGKATTRQKDAKRKSAAYNNLGSARMKQENFPGAEEAFKESLRLDPSNETARQNLAEAKRKRKQKEQQQQQNQQQQNQQQNQDQQQNQNQQQQNNNSSGQQQQEQQQQQQNQNQQQNSNQQQQQNTKSNSDSQQKGKEQQKLADKQTDRKLDELMRQEMDTKKRLDGSKGNSNGKAAKKDW